MGEVCHFVDLCTFLTGSVPRRVFATALRRDAEQDDSVVVQLRHADGSVATIEYLARTSSELPKERFEVSGGGATARCENFRTTRISAGRRVKT